jgi:hypothetical protein
VPEIVQEVNPVPAVTGTVDPNDKRLQINNFVLEIPVSIARSCKRWARSSFGFKPGGVPEVSRILLTLPWNADLTEWKKWSDQMGAAGSGPDDNEKTGMLQMLYRGVPTLTMDLSGLGVSRISFDKRVEKLAPVNEVELYCESIKIRAVEPPPPPPPPALLRRPRRCRCSWWATSMRSSSGRGRPLRPSWPRAATRALRDVMGIPRFKDSVRLSFSSSATKLETEEQAEYQTKVDPARVEEFYATKMKEEGWQAVWRKEAGSDASWVLDLRWDQNKSLGKVVLSRSKDGLTRIEVKRTTPVR